MNFCNLIKQKAQSDRRGAAYHEAGHAVVAWVLGIPIGAIEIAIDGDDAKGSAQIGATDGLEVVDRIAICLAGVEAQHLFAAPTHRHAGVADYAMVFNYVEDLDDEASLAIRNAGFQRAHDILDQHSEMVERLAKALTRALKMDAVSVNHVISGDQTGMPPSQISLAITNEQKQRLHEMGYDDEDVITMTPAEAHELLGFSRL